MTDNSENWEPQPRPAWQPKTPREEREALGNAPLATLLATPASRNAFLLMSDLAERYPRPQASKGKTYARNKTLVDYANAGGAFLVDLLTAATKGNRSEGWVRCSHDKSQYTGQYVSWAMFNGVRTAWLEAGLIEHKAGYPRMFTFGKPGPTVGKLTRYRATPKLLAIAAEHGITSSNVLEHFKIEFKMPSELVQLTSPSQRTPDTPKVVELREEVQELNDFFAKHALTPQSIKHLGWVRKFHLADHPDFRWNKGGRLYSYPYVEGANYQSIAKDARLKMAIDGEPVAEIDIGSSYLTIFYAWNDLQRDPEQDAYRGVLGSTELDRIVTKIWINAAFGYGTFHSTWSKDLKKDVTDRLLDKGIAPTAFSPKRYPPKMIKERVLQQHPLLAKWGGKIRGRVRDYGDLMFVESQVIIGSMLELKRDHGVPSMPVHDSLIVPVTQRHLAERVLKEQFQKKTGFIPRLEVHLPRSDL